MVRAHLVICVLLLPQQVVGHPHEMGDLLGNLITYLGFALAIAGLLGVRHGWRFQRAFSRTETLACLAEERREELARENEVLHDRLTSMEAMMFEVSHDLSSPLVSISGFARSAIRAQTRGQTEQILQYLERVEASAGSMSSLVNGILSVGRIGQEVPQTTEVYLSDIVAVLRIRLDHALQEKGTQLICTQDLLLETDPGMLSRALQNFAENAVRHGTLTEGQSIRVHGALNGSFVRIKVSDDGPGIPQELQTRLFALFQRGDHGASGSGLGLTIAARLADQLGGKTGFETRRDAGTDFWIDLPDLCAVARRAG